MGNLHLGNQRSSNPICGERNPVARVTTDPEYADCPRCRAKPSFASRLRERVAQQQRNAKRGAHVG